MKKFICAILSVAAAASFAVGAAAQESADIVQYYSDKNEITVYTSEQLGTNVTARISGVECPAENKGNIYDDSSRYETVFLIDSSKSMQSFSDEIDAFLRECIDTKRENEFFSIGLFSSANLPEYVISSESDRYALEKSIDSIKYDFDSTYIYDNLINTLDTLNFDDETIYRRVVLMTDGNENSARGITIDDVISSLEKNPIMIHTVTLETTTRSNLDNLKNVSRLARMSCANDIRIADGSNAAEYAQALSDYARKISCISVIPDSSLLDGSVKALEISDGNIIVNADVRLAMTDTVITSETVTESVVTATVESAAVTEAAKEPDDVKESSVSARTIIIIAAAAVIVIICIIVIAVNMEKNGKSKDTAAQPVSLADNDSTVILGSNRSGQTEMLFDSDMLERTRSVILRDTADSVRTFEFQLTADGTVIGRSSDMSNIVIDYDKAVSRKHMRIYLKNNQAYLEDLSSGNKTYLNGAEVTVPAAINNSDEIKIGRTRFKVTIK